MEILKRIIRNPNFQLLKFLMLIIQGAFVFTVFFMLSLSEGCFFYVCLLDTNPVPTISEYYKFVDYTVFKCIVICLLLILQRGHKIYKLSMTALIFIVSLIKIRIYLPVLSKNNELLRMCEKAIVINNLVIVIICILCSIIILKKKHK